VLLETQWDGCYQNTVCRYYSGPFAHLWHSIIDYTVYQIFLWRQYRLFFLRTCQESENFMKVVELQSCCTYRLKWISLCTSDIFWPVRVKFGLRGLHLVLLSIFVFCGNWHGKSVHFSVINKIILSCVLWNSMRFWK